MNWLPFACDPDIHPPLASELRCHDVRALIPATASRIPDIGCANPLWATRQDVDSILNAGLHSLRLIDDRRVISHWHRRLEFGYSVPTRDSVHILRDGFGLLEPQHVCSRGDLPHGCVKSAIRTIPSGRPWSS